MEVVALEGNLETRGTTGNLVPLETWYQLPGHLAAQSWGDGVVEGCVDPRLEAGTRPCQGGRCTYAHCRHDRLRHRCCQEGCVELLFDMPLAPVLPTAAAAAAPAAVQDDLEKYLAMPAETNMDLDTCSPGGRPRTARMACQRSPRWRTSSWAARRHRLVLRTCSRRRASSTTTLSKAGKLYDDAKKHQNEETLEAALFACANTERTGRGAGARVCVVRQWGLCD